MIIETMLHNRLSDIRSPIIVKTMTIKFNPNLCFSILLRKFLLICEKAFRRGTIRA